jgi:hypothetical protein
MVMSLNIASPDCAETFFFGRAARCVNLRRAGSLVELGDVLHQSVTDVVSPSTLDLIGHSTRGHRLLRLGDTPINMLDLTWRGSSRNWPKLAFCRGYRLSPFVFSAAKRRSPTPASARCACSRKRCACQSLVRASCCSRAIATRAASTRRSPTSSPRPRSFPDQPPLDKPAAASRPSSSREGSGRRAPPRHPACMGVSGGLDGQVGEVVNVREGRVDLAAYLS